MNPSNFVHPLSSLETIDTDEGKKQVINSWAFASMIWSAVLTNNSNARQIAKELFSSIPDGQDKFLTLHFRSKLGNKAAIRDAIAIMAFALDEKIQEAFENKV